MVIVQTKPYVCPNQNNCDVRIVYDKSGIKRKGARCQSCRYTACLDAGMSHPGSLGPHNYNDSSLMYYFFQDFQEPEEEGIELEMIKETKLPRLNLCPASKMQMTILWEQFL